MSSSAKKPTHQHAIIHFLRSTSFLLVIAGLVACRPREWKQYSHPEDGVAFSLPSEPVMTEKSFEAKAGHGNTRSYRTDSAGFGAPLYEVSVTTYPNDLDVKVSLENFKTKLSENGTKKIV